MWDYSADEMLALAVSAWTTIWAGTRWFSSLALVALPRSRGARSGRWMLAIAPILAAALLLLILRRWADPEQVAGRADYLLLFELAGVAFMSAAVALLPLTGLSARRDAIERANPATTAVVVGTILGVTLAYGGANVGRGPTVWTTFVPAAIACMILLALWCALALAGGAAEAVAVDRDVASGIRGGIFVVCAGAILSRAAAGDWNGSAGMLWDFLRIGWPSLLLLAIAWAMQVFYRPSPRDPQPSPLSRGVYPSMLLIAITAIWLFHAGRPVT